MWQIISNASAVVTLVLFVLYLIGHWWSIKISKKLLYEKFEIENLTDNELDEVDIFIDLGQSGDEVFSISSPNGIRRISIYDVKYNDKTNQFEKKRCLETIEDVNVDEKVYIRTLIPEGIANKYVEVEKCDYVKIGFALGTSGKNGNLVKIDYKCKMTIRSWIYYLCA